VDKPPDTPTANIEEQARLSDARLAELEKQSALISQLPRAAPPAPLFSHDPKDRFVIKTLDAEMARLEQAVTRSGWTSWASTAALGALAWIFIALLDDAPAFPWLRLAQFVTLLSLVQEFVYSVEENLRVRRGFGLLAGSQLRVMRTVEALPFARPQFLFYTVRASLLATASWTLLPDLVGGWWLAPFIIYVAVAVAMCLMLLVSMGDYALPKHLDAPTGELIGAGAALGVALLGLDAMLDTWQGGDLLVFKAALVVIAGVHVIRGLTAPQYELPALDQLQDIRRKLGFGQLSALEAVARADAALVGHMALTFLLDPVAVMQEPTEKLQTGVEALGEDVALLERQLQALAGQNEVSKDHLRMQESLIGRAINRCSDLLQTVPAIVDAREQLRDELDRYKKGTKNDQSVPMVETVEKRLTASCAATLMQLRPHIARLHLALGALDELAARHQSPVDSSLRAVLDRLSKDAHALLENFQSSLPKKLAAGDKD